MIRFKNIREQPSFIYTYLEMYQSGACSPILLINQWYTGLPSKHEAKMIVW